ncbi:MAG: FtsQ-type POTRA domain-containing protein [Oscillospiraceae bacterium]|nr:FtsQ-type POTRA domain-containing protein [Oscillospiraceae bacterium]
MQDVVKQSVKRQRSSKRRRRRTRGHRAYILLVIVLVIGLAAALSMTLFFNIKDIVVINETDTPDEQIVALSQIKYHDNLVRLDTNIAAERVRANVVYAEKVTVTRQFPSTVEIKVERAVPVANITQSYGYLLVSSSNRVLEELKEDPYPGLLIISGYNPAEGSIGMVLRSEDEKRDNILKTLTAAVSECGDPRIWSLDMADQSDILVYIGSNAVFHMGNSSDAVYKLRLALTVFEKLNNLNANKNYKLTMIGNKQISVLPLETIENPVTTPSWLSMITETAPQSAETTTTTTSTAIE